jgi:hypothetical protein
MIFKLKKKQIIFKKYFKNKIKVYKEKFVLKACIKNK